MKKKIIISAVVFLFIASAAVYYILNNSNSIEVEIFEAKRGNVSSYVEEVGTVKSKSERQIYSKATGEIQEILVEVGDLVKEDDIIAMIDSEKIDLEIKSLEAQMEGIRATYKEAIKPVDKEKIANAQAEIEAIRVRLNDAKRQAEKNEKLYEEGAISEEAYQSSLDNLAIEEKNLEIAENSLALLQKEVSENIKSKYESEIAQLAYQIEILEESKRDLIIKAPVEGIVTEISVKEGAFVQPGTEIAEIGNLEDIYLEVDILASEVIDIVEGAYTEIYGEEYGILYGKGSVDKIYPKAFSKLSDLGIEQKRVRIDVNIPKELSSNLKLGYELDVKIFDKRAKDVIYIPESAVFEIEGNKYVFVAEGGKANLRKVEIGIEGDEVLHITSGLNEGERVVISPSENLEDGINIVEKQ